MKLLCEFSQESNSRIGCMVNNKPCTFQRYCTMKHEWQNTSGYSGCERRRKGMARKKTGEINEKGVETMEENTEFVTTEPSVEPEVEVATPVELTIDENLNIVDSSDKKEAEATVREGRVIGFAGNYTIVKDETTGVTTTVHGRIGRLGHKVSY